MTSTELVLCSLQAHDIDKSPRSSRIEARARPQGFSVRFKDDDLCPYGQEILQHGRMPRGKVDVVFETRGGVHMSLGIEDFDQLSKLEP